MAGAELPCPSIDRPLWPGSGSSGEAGQRASPARYDDDSGKRVEGLAARHGTRMDQAQEKLTGGVADATVGGSARTATDDSWR
jgi:hypothetical protein